MEIHTSEQEQIEEIKKWWAENGKAVILGIVVGAAGLFGWQSWKEHQQEITEDASALYTTLVTELEAGQLGKIDGYAEEIVTDFGSTAYASLASLAAAKANVKLGKHEEAKVRLQWVRENSGLSELVIVAKLRLASIQISDKEFDQAEKLLNGIYSHTFSGIVNELKGDLLVAKGDIDSARLSYDQALSGELPSQKRQLVQLKRDQLGEAPAMLKPEPKRDEPKLIPVQPEPSA